MKKVLVGMFALVMCAGMAMAHIQRTVCPNCKKTLSEKMINVRISNNKMCNKCSQVDLVDGSLCSECEQKKNFCEIIEQDAEKGKDGAAQYFFSNGCNKF